MNAKGIVIILVILSLGLGAGLIVRNKNANEEKTQHLGQIAQLSNTVVQTEGSLTEQRNVNLRLETNYALVKSELEAASNKLITTETTLASTKSNLEKSQAEIKAAQEELAKRDAKIAELEGQNDEMTKKMVDLNTTLGNLEKQIADTEKKLTASEGDRTFLLKELKRLQAEKAELEKQFNDLAVLRDQVRKLKEELSISRRLEWIRQGIYGRQGQKGGEALIAPAVPKSTNQTGLKVELKQDGSVKIQTPATNTPAK